MFGRTWIERRARALVRASSIRAGASAAAIVFAVVASVPLPRVAYAADLSSRHAVTGLRSCTVGTRLAGWTTARLAAQTIVVPVDSAAVASVGGLVDRGVGGVILFGSDATPALPDAIAALDRHALGGVDPAVMVDEEGGSVQRLANLVGSMPSARTMAATLTLPAIEALAQRDAQRLRSLGVTFDLAPVLDLDSGPGPNNYDADGTRSFSSVPPIASAAADAFASGLQSGGVLPVFKHFPGLGGASGNTDLGPASTLGYSTLRRGGLLPFENAIAKGAAAIMVSNASVPGLSASPSSISSAVITTLLRNQLHFGGLVLTDSLSAPSVTPNGASLSRSIVAALVAGADMVLFNATATSVTPTTVAAISAISAGVTSGALPRSQLVTAVGRILAVKHDLPGCPK